MTTFLSTSKGEITIRIATSEQAGKLLDLRLESLSMHPEAFAADIAITTANGINDWTRLIDGYQKDKSGAMCIALAGEAMIGMAGIVRGHWPKTRHSASLWGVYVKSTWRGMQVGAGVVNGCIAWALENNLKVVYLGVVTTNLLAIRCYERCEFKSYGTQPRVIYYDGKYYDELMMARLL